MAVNDLTDYELLSALKRVHNCLSSPYMKEPARSTASQLLIAVCESISDLGRFDAVRDKWLEDAERAAEDTARMDWIIDNCKTHGGGDGFMLNVWVGHDSECVRHAIDEMIKKGN